MDGIRKSHDEIGVYTIIDPCVLPLAVICDTLVEDKWHGHQDKYCDGVDKHGVI